MMLSLTNQQTGGATPVVLKDRLLTDSVVFSEDFPSMNTTHNVITATTTATRLFPFYFIIYKINSQLFYKNYYMHLLIFLLIAVLVVDHQNILIPLALPFPLLSARQHFQGRQQKYNQQIQRIKYVAVMPLKCGGLQREVMEIRCRNRL